MHANLGTQDAPETFTSAVGGTLDALSLALAPLLFGPAAQLNRFLLAITHIVDEGSH
jgi:hypothetical protein